MSLVDALDPGFDLFRIAFADREVAAPMNERAVAIRNRKDLDLAAIVVNRKRRRGQKGVAEISLVVRQRDQSFAQFIAAFEHQASDRADLVNGMFAFDIAGRDVA